MHLIRRQYADLGAVHRFTPPRKNSLMQKLTMITAAALVALSAAAASAEEQYCTGQGEPMAEEQVIKKLETLGYQKVKKLDMEHGCYEAKGFDKDGNRVEVYLEPATGEVVKVKTS